MSRVKIVAAELTSALEAPMTAARKPARMIPLSPVVPKVFTAKLKVRLGLLSI